jgi:hypothetical protein
MLLLGFMPNSELKPLASTGADSSSNEVGGVAMSGNL